LTFKEKKLPPACQQARLQVISYKLQVAKIIFIRITCYFGSLKDVFFNYFCILNLKLKVLKASFWIFILLAFLKGFTAYSQSASGRGSSDDIFDRLYKDRPGTGDITVVQDARLAEVLQEYIEINRQKNGIPCYWIRIYSGSGHDAREKAYQSKAKFLSKYEGIKDKVVYDNPNFKVYIGGYRVKSDALKLLKIVQQDFPSAFIIYDIIDFPDL
jgi:hypothetical protein